jgi:hypothetical protein
MIEQPKGEAFATFEFSLTRQDYVKLHHEVVATSPEWRSYIKSTRRRALWSTLGGAIGIALGFVPLIAYAMEGRVSEFMIGMGLCLSAASSAALYNASTLRKQLREQIEGTALAAKSSTDAYDWGVWRIAFFAEGVRFTTAYRDGFSSWAVILQVKEFPSFIVVEEISHGAYTIPRSQFASEHAERAFIERCRAVLAERGAGVANRIAKFLADHDVACPSCGYALRGCGGVACPECGLPLTLANVPQAIERPPTP